MASEQCAAVPGVLRVFGQQLKLLRERAGLGRPEFGEAMGYAPTTIAAYEQGRRIAQPEFVKKADELLGGGGMLTAVVKELARQRYPARFQDFAELEADAVSHYSYESQVIPGLLQTEGYVRALLQVHCPPLDDETIEQRTAARLERQALLTRKNAPVLGFVIEEVALRRPVGGTTTMKGQLLRLLEAAEYRNVTVQVMPTSRGAHMGLNGPMVLIETSERQLFGYTEAQGVSTIIADRDEASVFSQRYGIIRAHALGSDESMRFIEQLAGEV